MTKYFSKSKPEPPIRTKECQCLNEHSISGYGRIKGRDIPNYVPDFLCGALVALVRWAPFLKETWLTWRFYEICHIVHHLKLGRPAPAAWLLVGGRLSGQISLLSRLYAFRAMSCCLSFGWCWLLCLCWIEKPPFSIFGHHKFLLEKERLFDPNNLWLFTPLWHPYFSHQNVSPLQYYS